MQAVTQGKGKSLILMLIYTLILVSMLALFLRLNKASCAWAFSCIYICLPRLWKPGFKYTLINDRAVAFPMMPVIRRFHFIVVCFSRFFCKLIGCLCLCFFRKWSRMWGDFCASSFQKTNMLKSEAASVRVEKGIANAGIRSHLG